MTAEVDVPFIPYDHPLYERVQSVHWDGEVLSTRMAASVAMDAWAMGYPGDVGAARRALVGPAATAAVQAAMQTFVVSANEHDRQAEAHSVQAVKLAEQALATAERRQQLPDESVLLRDGSSQTRAHIQLGHEQRLKATAMRESRGDFEHYLQAPPLYKIWGAALVLALIEAALLVWPVTNASIHDLALALSAVCLVILFLFMNEALPRHAGEAVREVREARQAAEELTRVGVTKGRAGNIEDGREALGQVDARFVRRAERKMVLRCAILGVIVAVYAVVMFTRTYALASSLEQSWLFPFVAAILITAFTAGAPIVISWWWSRGNALGDQLREYGRVTDESRSRHESLAGEVVDEARQSADSMAAARVEVVMGDQEVGQGVPIVARGLQKAAKLLDQEAILGPSPEGPALGPMPARTGEIFDFMRHNPVFGPRLESLFQAYRPWRTRTLANLVRAHRTLTSVQQALAAAPAFAPATSAPDPWAVRSERRAAPPNLDFVDPAVTATMATAATADGRPRSSRKRMFKFAGTGACVLAVAALLVILLGPVS